jgi:general secretion pathway protein I
MSQIKVRPGFSVMETLVAVALLAIAVIPLYAFQQALADSAARLQTTAMALEAEESALALLQAIDPIAEPEGEMMLGEWRLTWTSTELAYNPDAEGVFGRGLYAIGLYEIRAELERNGTVRSFTLRRVGWRRVRDPLGL